MKEWVKIDGKWYEVQEVAGKDIWVYRLGLIVELYPKTAVQAWKR